MAETPESDQRSPGFTLRGISVILPSGSMTAIVGESGAGKSTFCNLVNGLYEPTDGRVLIGGVDTRDLGPSRVRDMMGVVNQDPYLFHDSIFANLRFARPAASIQEIDLACEAACIRELIMNLPAGYDTIVGDRGYRLSGGERQRLAIARALLKDPQIIILDEATSHLDSQTEIGVRLALDALLRGRTSVVIAHRLSTVTRAEQIIVLRAGEIVDVGTHDSLSAKPGLYRSLCLSQFGAFAADPSSRAFGA